MKKWTFVGLGLAAVLLVQAASGAPYQQATGSLAASESELVPGSTVTLSGSGFAPHSSVVITVESEPRTLATVDADANGSISVDVSLPPDLAPGDHTLKATGFAPDGATVVLSKEVEVLAAGAPARSDANGGIPVALWALLVGGVAVVVALGVVVLRRVA